MESRKRVAIIGAGPSGLVAAKSLLHYAPHASNSGFQVTVFEKSGRIGGLWPISREESGGMVNPEMCTNQSRHTVAFSDFAWGSHLDGQGGDEEGRVKGNGVDGQGKSGKEVEKVEGGEGLKSFPQAWEVGQYLAAYWERYRKDADLRLGSEVVSVEKRKGGEGWVVCVKGKEGKEEFDFVIVATGFFGKAKIPPSLEGVKGVNIKHSSQVRDVRELVTGGGGKGKNIVVVGGQMSGVETAAAIAFQISSLVNSPGDEKVSKEWEGYKVVHVVKKPVWILPLFFPRDPEVEDESGVKIKNPSPEFLPLDLVNYNLGWRPPGPIQNTSGEISVEGAKKVHAFVENYVGTDQSEYGVPVLSMKSGEARSQPPMMACSDYYTEFVRSGQIEVIQGGMKSVSEDGMAMQIEDSSRKTSEIPNIASIICATGFDAFPSLSFLPSSLLHQLQFDPTSDSFPLALSVHGVISKSLPTLGFVGFYRSPYWGVMEIQSRYLASLFSGSEKSLLALSEDTTMEKSLKLRNNPRRAQFPMGDYAYLMESFAEILDIKRSSPETREGIVLPFRYLPSSASDAQRQEARLSLERIGDIFSKPKSYIGRATFRALQGSWSLSRTITSKLSSFPSGSLIGTASFLPRNSTLENTDLEMLYREEGAFRPSWGGEMRAKRAYVWGWGEEGDKVDVWFAKGDGRGRDYFFHRLGFEKGGREGGWKARAEHLCVEDLYNVEYEFFFKGTLIERWTSRYVVKGPKKDYVIENVYMRPV